MSNRPDWCPADVWVLVQSLSIKNGTPLNEIIAWAVIAERDRCIAAANMFNGYADSAAGSVHTYDAKKLVEEAAESIKIEIIKPSCLSEEGEKFVQAAIREILGK